LTGTLDELANALESRLPGVRRGDPSDVHRTRVAARRLREALALVGDSDEPAAKPARRSIRRLRRALGPVRELDVALTVFEDEARRHDWPIGAVTCVRGALLADRERRRLHMLRRITRAAPGELLADLQRLASSLPASKDDEAPILSARVLKRSRQFDAAIRRVGPLYRPEALHRVRIAGKKLRYALELVQRHGHQPVSRDLATLRHWQAILGRMNDLHVLQTHLAGIAADSASHAVRHAVEAMDRTIEVECRGVHAKFLGAASKLLVLASRVRLACLTLRRPKSTRIAKLPSPRPVTVARPKFARGA
jgi:CHAD domain-containing protein